MFKKIILFTLVLTFGLGFFKASAFIGKPAKNYSENATYTVSAISEHDFKDTIYSEMTGVPTNATVTIYANDRDTPKSDVFIAAEKSDASGKLDRGFVWDWTVKTLPHTYNMQVYAKVDGSTDQSNFANYAITVNNATITMTASTSYIYNKAGSNDHLKEGDIIPMGSVVNMSCSNASGLYFGLSSDYPLAGKDGQPIAQQYSGDTLDDYIISRDKIVDDPGTYKIECDNIGGTNTRQTLTFKVAESYDITDIKSSPNKTDQSDTVSWSSVADSCTILSDVGDGFKTATKNGNAFSITYPKNTFDDVYNHPFTIHCTSDDKYPADDIKPSSVNEPNPFLGIALFHQRFTTDKAYFNISGANSLPNNIGKDNTVTWTSTADYCNVYDSSKNNRIGIGAKSGSNWSATVSSSNVLTSPGSQTYQLKCADNTDYPASGLGADSDSHTGWRSYSANIAYGTCQNGQIGDSNHYCHTPCTTGYTWNESSKSCQANPTPTGNLSLNPKSCIILANASTCTVKLSWNTANGVGTSEITSNSPNNSTTVATGNTGSQVSGTVYHDGRKLYLYNNENLLDQVNITASCATGTTWDSGENKCLVNKAYFDISPVDSSPNKASSTENFTWNSTASTCNLYNYDKSSKLATGVASGDNYSASIILGHHTGDQGYYIKCYDATEYPAASLGTDTDHFKGFSLILKYVIKKTI